MTDSLRRAIQSTQNQILSRGSEDYTLLPETAEDICSIDPSVDRDMQYLACAQELRRYENLSPARSILRSLRSHSEDPAIRETATYFYRDSLGYDILDGEGNVIQEAGFNALSPLDWNRNLSDEAERAGRFQNHLLNGLSAVLGPIPGWYLAYKISGEAKAPDLLAQDLSFDHRMPSSSAQFGNFLMNYFGLNTALVAVEGTLGVFEALGADGLVESFSKLVEPSPE